MNDQHQTPSQIAAANREAAAHHEHDHRTPSQIARDNQLMPHGHGLGHGRETQEAADKPQGMTWQEWLKLTRDKAGGNDGNDAYNREQERILPEEERQDKGRER